MPSETTPATRIVLLLLVVVGGTPRSSGGSVDEVGIGPVLGVVGTAVVGTAAVGTNVEGAAVEVGAEVVGVEPRPACSTEPHALTKLSARTPMRVAAVALVIRF